MIRLRVCYAPRGCRIIITANGVAQSGTATVFIVLACSPVTSKRDFPAQYYKILETSSEIKVEDV